MNLYWASGWNIPVIWYDICKSQPSCLKRPESESESEFKFRGCVCNSVDVTPIILPSENESLSYEKVKQATLKAKNFPLPIRLNRVTLSYSLTEALTDFANWDQTRFPADSYQWNDGIYQLLR